MRIVLFSRLDELVPYAETWDRLAAGVPFCTWAWMSCWWEHFGPAAGRGGKGRRLTVLGVFDSADRMLALAPWHVERSRTHGRVLRWLGSGEVCSDYLGLLCQPAAEEPVAEALADYLLGQADTGSGADLPWDLLAVEGVEAGHLPTARLVEQLARRGCLVHAGSPVNFWRIDLPDSWEAYLAMLSRPHAKRLRHLDRAVFQTGRGAVHRVQSAGQLPQAIEILTRLHQRRWNARGRPGCFASASYAEFHRALMPKALAQGQLRLQWLELDGRPAAAEYHLAGGGITYAYQSGIDPERLAAQPGRLLSLATLRRTIEEGGRAFDFLRGDEPYKAHLRATPRPGLSLRIVPARAAARLRHRLWLAGRKVKQWL
ncbi:MAG: GNAT family N-acetyltransferase [Thermoguttaceae bacterium]|jgi:CelD/BcsL family acetyltransferase involved in cellulose biosynthesis